MAVTRPTPASLSTSVSTLSRLSNIQSDACPACARPPTPTTPRSISPETLVGLDCPRVRRAFHIHRLGARTNDEPCSNAATRCLAMRSMSLTESSLLPYIPTCKRPDFRGVESLTAEGCLRTGNKRLVLFFSEPTTPSRDEPIRAYAPLLMLPWIMHVCPPRVTLIPSPHLTHAGTVYVVDIYGHQRKLVDPTLSQVPGAQSKTPTSGTVAVDIYIRVCL